MTLAKLFTLKLGRTDLLCSRYECLRTGNVSTEHAITNA